MYKQQFQNLFNSHQLHKYGSRKPLRFWNKLTNQKTFMDNLGKELNIRFMEDWYKVSLQTVIEHGGGTLLNKYNRSLTKALAKIYPSYLWESYNFYHPHQRSHHIKGQVSKGQYALVQSVQQLFPNKSILINFHHKDLSKLELDIFLPEYSLALEYQGEPHYHQVPIYRSVTKIKERDTMKIQITKDLGITLIGIPYWWDKSTESVASIIHSVRHDLQFDISQNQSLKSQPATMITPIPLWVNQTKFNTATVLYSEMVT